MIICIHVFKCAFSAKFILKNTGVLFRRNRTASLQLMEKNTEKIWLIRGKVRKSTLKSVKQGEQKYVEQRIQRNSAEFRRTPRSQDVLWHSILLQRIRVRITPNYSTERNLFSPLCSALLEQSPGGDGVLRGVEIFTPPATLHGTSKFQYDHEQFWWC